MKNNKNGISLIVLVITIIVMIILAASVVITLSNTGIINKANDATYETELKQIQTLASLAWSDAYTAKMTDSTINIEEEVKLALERQGIARDKYIMEVSDTGVVISAYTKDGTIKATTISGQLPLALNSSAGVKLDNYKIYGESVQNGTPTPIAPVEIQSVGEKTNNLFDCFLVTAGDYKLNEMLDNGYGTTINTTVYNGEIKVTQTQYPDSDYLGSYFNGFFSVGVNGLEVGKTYTVFFDFEILNNPLNAEAIEIFTDRKHYVAENYGNRAKITFVSGAAEFGGEIKDEYIEFRNCGMSLIIKNIILLEGDVDEFPEYEPYGYRIPVKVSNNTDEIVTNIYLDEPLRGIGEYRDYIDFSNQTVVRKITSEYITTVPGVSGVYTTYIRFLTGINNEPLLFETDLETPTPITKQGIAISNKFSRSEVPYNAMGEYPWIIQPYKTTEGYNRVAYTFADKKITSVGQALAEIGDGFEVCYVMKNEIIQPVTLPDISTLKGSCTLSVETTVKPSNVEITCKTVE